MDKAEIINEHFVPIVGYPRYEISNYGRVINVDSADEHEVYAWPDGTTARYKITLTCETHKRTFYLHRLVAAAFFADFESKDRVMHIVKNYADNAITNLHLRKSTGKKQHDITKSKIKRGV